MDEKDMVKAFYGSAIDALLPIVLAFVAYSISKVLGALKKRLSINVNVEKEKWIQLEAQKVVQSVAEASAYAVKWKKAQLTPEAKQKAAISCLTNKVKGLTDNNAREYVNAALSKIYGEGATGERVLVAGKNEEECNDGNTR